MYNKYECFINLHFIGNTNDVKSFHYFVIKMHYHHHYIYSEFGISDSLHQYEFWLQCMFLVIVPVVSIFTCNMLIICKVRTINRLIGSKKGSAGKERSLQSETQLTRLLLTVTFTFLALNSLECIVSCFVMLKAVSI